MSCLSCVTLLVATILLNDPLYSILPDRAPGPNTGTHESEHKPLTMEPHLLECSRALRRLVGYMTKFTWAPSFPPHGTTCEPAGLKCAGGCTGTLAQQQQRIGGWGTRLERGAAARWRAHRGLQGGRGDVGLALEMHHADANSRRGCGRRAPA